MASCLPCLTTVPFQVGSPLKGTMVVVTVAKSTAVVVTDDAITVVIELFKWVVAVVVILRVK